MRLEVPMIKNLADSLPRAFSSHHHMVSAYYKTPNLLFYGECSIPDKACRGDSLWAEIFGGRDLSRPYGFPGILPWVSFSEDAINCVPTDFLELSLQDLLLMQFAW